MLYEPAACQLDCLHCDLHATYGLSCSVLHSNVLRSAGLVSACETVQGPRHARQLALPSAGGNTGLGGGDGDAATWLSEINLEVSALLQLICSPGYAELIAQCKMLKVSHSTSRYEQ